MVASKFIQRPLMAISQMENWKKVSDRLSDPELFIQHGITSTKLYNAKSHFKTLEKLVPNHTAKDLIKIEFGKKKLIHEIPSSPSKKNLQFYDELEFIFYNLRSCIDSFLWEINLIFELRCPKAGQVRDAMNSECEEKEITNLLNNLQKEDWFEYLSEIRNNLTHRLLSEVAIAEDLKLYLPSIRFTKEPSLFPFSLEKEYELFPCLDRLIENTQDFLERGYKILLYEFPVK